MPMKIILLPCEQSCEIAHQPCSHEVEAWGCHAKHGEEFEDKGQSEEEKTDIAHFVSFTVMGGASSRFLYAAFRALRASFISSSV